MVRQSVTRDGNIFVQYGRGYEMPEQHGGEEEWIEDMKKTRIQDCVVAKMKPHAAMGGLALGDIAQLQSTFGMQCQREIEALDQAADSGTIGEKSQKDGTTAVGFLQTDINPLTREVPLGMSKQRQSEAKDDEGPKIPQDDGGPETPKDDTKDTSGASDEQIRDGTQRLSSDIEQLRGASSLDRIRILEAIQLDPNLQALVQAGLMNWNDIMSKNTGSVVAPDGSVPEKVVDEKKLKALQSRLLKLGMQQQATEAVQLRRRIKQQATPGPKPGMGFFGKKDVYMPPRYLPGRLPEPKNKVLV